MLAAPKRPRSTLLSILLLWIAFYASFTLFTPALLDDADSVHAEVAREMLLRHDFITLYANGIRYLEKAPLLYWSMASSFRLFGVSTAAARIPLALTVLALALAVETFARSAFYSHRAGLNAALILLSSPGLFLFTRINLPDAMVCLWLTLAMLSFHLTELESEGLKLRLLCYLFAAACALNVLTKGLIGILFPTAIVLIYLLLTRGARQTIIRVRQLHPISSLAVFLAIAAPWHILVALANPAQGHPGNLSYQNGHLAVPLPTDGNVHGWFWFYFVNEQLLRYLNLRVPRDYDTVPLWLFWGMCFVWLMPWSAFAIQAIASAVSLRSKQWRERFRSQTLPPDRLAFILIAVWAAVPLIFFSLSTRQEYYVLPSLPAIALLIAKWLSAPTDEEAAGETRNRDLFLDRSTFVLLIVGALFAATVLVFVLRTRKPAHNVDLAQLLQQNPADYALSMGHFFDLNSQSLSLFRMPLGLAAASLFFGPLASHILRKRARSHAANLALAAGAFGFLLAAHLALQTFAPVLSSEQLAAAIAPQVHPSDLIVIHQEYEFGSTLGFYLRRADLHILEGRSSNLWYGSFFPDAPKIFETPESLAAKWSGAQRIFLWQDLANQPSALPPLPGAVYLIASSGGKEIVSNQPSEPPSNRSLMK